MPIYSVQGPDGRIYDVEGPAGASEEQILSVVRRQYLTASAPAPQKGGSGLGDIARSFGLGAVGATGALASVFGADNAAARGLSEAGESLQAGFSSARKAELQKQAERMKKAEESGSTWQEIKAGLLNVLEAPVQSTAQAVGSFVPMVATLPLAKLGLGARAVMAVRGAIGGAQGAGAVKQSVYEAVLGAETEEGKSLEQARAAATRAQEYVGANLDQIMFGTGLGFVAGTSGVERMLPGGARATAGAAQQAMAKRIGERAATGVTTAAAEMPIEGAQGGQERLAANLALQRTGRDVGTFTGVAGQATQEALTGGLGGGALGAAMPDRSLSRAAAEEKKKQRDAQAALAKEAAEQQRAAKQEEEAQRQTPEYALDVAQKYDALLQEFQAKKAALKNPGKDATPVEKAEYKDAQKELQDLNTQLKDIVPEYRRTAPIRKQAQEQARVDALSPEDFMLEQTMGGEGMQAAGRARGERGALFGREQLPAAPADTSVQDYATERVELAREQLVAPTGAEYLDYLMQDPAMAAKVVETKATLPGLSPSEAGLLRGDLKKTLAKQAAEREKAAVTATKTELQQRQADLQAQKTTPDTDPLAMLRESEAEVEQQRAEGETNFDYLDDMFGQAFENQAPAIAAPEGLRPTPAAPTIKRTVEKLIADRDQAEQDRVAANVAGERAAARAAAERAEQAKTALNRVAKEVGDTAPYAAAIVNNRNVQEKALFDLEDVLDKIKRGVVLGGAATEEATTTRAELQAQADAAKKTYIRAVLAEAAAHRRAQGTPAIDTDAAVKAASEMDTALEEMIVRMQAAPRRESLQEVITKPAQVRGTEVVSEAETEMRDMRPLEERRFGAPTEAVKVIQEQLANIREALSNARGEARKIEAEPLTRQYASTEAKKVAEAKGETATTVGGELRRRTEYVRDLMGKPARSVLIPRVRELLNRAADVMDEGRATRDLLDAVENVASRLADGRRVNQTDAREINDALAAINKQAREGERVGRVEGQGELFTERQDRNREDETLGVVRQSFTNLMKSPPVMKGRAAIEQAKKAVADAKARAEAEQKKKGVQQVRRLAEMKDAVEAQRQDLQRAINNAMDAERGALSAAAKMQDAPVVAAQKALENAKKDLDALQAKIDAAPEFAEKLQYANDLIAQRKALDDAQTTLDSEIAQSQATYDGAVLVAAAHRDSMVQFERKALEKFEKRLEKLRGEAGAEVGAEVASVQREAAEQRARVAKAENDARLAAERAGREKRKLEQRLLSGLGLEGVKRVGGETAAIKSDTDKAVDAERKKARDNLEQAMETLGRKQDVPQLARVTSPVTRDVTKPGRLEESRKPKQTNVAITQSEMQQANRISEEARLANEDAARIRNMSEKERKAQEKEEKALAKELAKIKGLFFSRGAPADGGQTVEALEKALDKVVGDPGVAGKRIKIFQSVSDLFNDPAHKYDYDGADIPADAKAFVNPKNGQAFMFADNIGKGEALGVLLHEIGVHVGFRNLFNKAQYARLVSAVKGWANRNDNSLESRIAKRAVARVEAAETTAAQYDDELLAYTVEEAIKAGVNPDALQGGSPIRNWLKSVMGVLRNALSKYGINTKTLTTGDLVNMAYGAAQLELRGTWHGSDAAFTAFNTKYAGAGEGAFDLRFEAEKSLGAGPYTTPNKEYAEYYQNAVPFGKAANESGYGAKTYQDYRAMDEKFMTTANEDLSTAALQSKFESRIVTAYLTGVNDGQSLDPAQNKNAAAMLNRLQTGARTPKEEKAAATLSLQKIKALKTYPSKGNLYRTLDDIPRARVYSVNSDLKVGERPELDALLQKYGDDWAKRTAKDTGSYPANTVFFNMREKIGIKKATELLKAAGIDAIEQNNERGKYVERAYIDQAPEILGVNLEPVGPATGKGRPGTGTLLFSRGAPAPANAIEALSRDIVAQPKTLKQKLGDSVALQAEMQAVDMRAGLREVLKAGAAEMGDDTKFTQAMYNVLKADQKMPVAYAVMSMGPLELYKDAKGFYGVRSTNKHSAKDVFDAIADMPGTDTQSKIDVATTYMIAQRAANKGLSKLDLGELGVTQEKLDAAMAAVEADPALKKALEAVRRAYNAYNKGQISFLAASGAIPKQVAEKLLADGDYVPYYRVKDNGMAELNFGNNVMVSIGDIRRQPYLASLKGGETKILPLNESLPLNTFLLTDMALTNMATKNVAYALQAMGKPSNVMQIQPGTGPADPGVIRFKQEPDPNKPNDDGDRWLKVETKGTAAEGVPAELLVQSLEGSHLALPEFLKLGGIAADLLRSGVTRAPLYIARQLIREPMAAAFTGGLNYNAFTAVLKAGKEFVRMSRGTSDAQMKLLEKGLVQSGIFAGDTSDMKKMALQIASGKDQSVMDKVFAAADRAALRADAATRALVYENAEANGLSDVEADMMTMESMNFYKRGLSPTLQYASRLIPFFNAQIQGLNVLFKAARGNMPFEEQQQIKRKFFNNAMLLVATGLVYAMAMEDDETFRNARPRDKYTNFFLPIPGLDEPIKLPIPFEAGYFYSLAVAAVDGMRAETDSKEQWQAIRDLFLDSIPGYSSMGMPQIVKPAFEVWTNKNFMSGSAVESRRFQGMDPEERYNANTTELAKSLSKALPILSPIQIEHMVRGYLGVLPLAAAGAANGLFAREGKGEAPEKRLSELPVIGPAFQKKYGGADKDVAYEMAKEAMDAKTTLNKLVAEGRREDAVDYRDKNRARLAVASAAGQYRQLVGRINADLRRTQERNDLSAAEKRVRIDNLEKAADEAAKRFTQRVRQVRDQ